MKYCCFSLRVVNDSSVKLCDPRVLVQFPDFRPDIQKNLVKGLTLDRHPSLTATTHASFFEEFQFDDRARDISEHTMRMVESIRGHDSTEYFTFGLGFEKS